MKQSADAVPPDIALTGGERDFAVAIPGPVDHEGLPSQIGHIHELPETAVVTFIAVVPHHEKAVRRNFNGARIVSCAYTGGEVSAVAVNRVWFRKRLVVDEHLFVLNSHGVTWQADYTLNEVFRWVDRITEDNDVLSFGLANGNELFVPVGKSDSVDKLVDQDVIPDKQRGLHGTRGDFECLNNKSADHQSKKKSNDDGFSIVTNDAFGFALGDAFLGCKLQN